MWREKQHIRSLLMGASGDSGGERQKQVEFIRLSLSPAWERSDVESNGSEPIQPVSSGRIAVA